MFRNLGNLRGILVCKINIGHVTKSVHHRNPKVSGSLYLKLVIPQACFNSGSAYLRVVKAIEHSWSTRQTYQPSMASTYTEEWLRKVKHFYGATLRNFFRMHIFTNILITHTALILSGLFVYMLFCVYLPLQFSPRIAARCPLWALFVSRAELLVYYL